MRALAEQFYAGLSRGQLLIQTCTGCGKDSMYPRERCPFCYASSLQWKPATGSGRLYSFTVQRAGAPTGFEDELPYALGIVRLDEGPQVLARLRPDEDGTWDDYDVDVPVVLCEPPSLKPDRPPAPWFTRADQPT
jgi:hypothetical protein